MGLILYDVDPLCTDVKGLNCIMYGTYSNYPLGTRPRNKTNQGGYLAAKKKKEKENHSKHEIQRKLFKMTPNSKNPCVQSLSDPTVGRRY